MTFYQIFTQQLIFSYGFVYTAVWKSGIIIHAFVTSKEKEISENECKTNRDNLHSSALSKIDAHYQF